jgi:hypothetical protein
MTILSMSSVNRSRRLQHQIELGVEARRSLLLLLALLHDLAPEAHEVAHVGLELLLREPLGERAHDEPARRRLHPIDRIPQARALFLRADALRDADVIDRRQEHHVAARQRDVARDARALRADGLLRDLHEDLLSLAHHLADRRRLRDARRLVLSRTPSVPTSLATFASFATTAFAARFAARRAGSFGSRDCGRRNRPRGAPIARAHAASNPPTTSLRAGARHRQIPRGALFERSRRSPIGALFHGALHTRQLELRVDVRFFAAFGEHGRRSVFGGRRRLQEHLGLLRVGLRRVGLPIGRKIPLFGVFDDPLGGELDGDLGLDDLVIGGRFGRFDLGHQPGFEQQGVVFVVDVGDGARGHPGRRRGRRSHTTLARPFGHAASAAFIVPSAPVACQVRLEIIGANQVFDVEERGPLEAHVDEGGLHAREHAAHLPHVDVAERSFLGFALDVELDDDAVFDERDANLANIDVDDEEIFGHGLGWAQPDPPPPASGARAGSRREGPRGKLWPHWGAFGVPIGETPRRRARGSEGGPGEGPRYEEWRKLAVR